MSSATFPSCRRTKQGNISLLPMMYLVLILVVPMMSRPRAHVGQRLAVGNKSRKLRPVHATVVVGVEHAHDLARNLIAALRRDVPVRLVHQTVGALDLLGLPVTVGVVVVQREEGGGIELADVVLLGHVPRH